ncbi:MAG TPA: stage II sporulation protein R [Epulopiscium sp.]|nr:stage II sporulation protein R [Candidatus Epulonipiscium sp.]
MSKTFTNIASIVAAIICGVIITTGITFAGERYSKGVTDKLSEHLIRFHLIANSDTVEDQQMKEHIRDVVLAYMSPLLKDSQSIEQTRTIIIDETPNIEQIALDVINKWGKEYTVKVLLEKVDFPTKRYGDITLPAGEYEACRIIIGEGKGKNWWCVMFPPLCYVDVTSGVVPSEQKEKLRASISEEEYELITRSTSTLNKDMPIKFKFKIVEVFNKKKSKHR